MSTGGEKLGGGYFEIGADFGSFDAAMDALPKRAAAKMAAVMQRLKSEMVQTRLELKVATKAGEVNAVNQLTQQYDALQKKVDAVTAATIRQAQAIRGATSLADVGDAGKKAGDGVRKGGMSGAMGLLVMSQVIDDMRYGFGAIVNQMPQIGMGLAGLIGKSAQWGMALGGVLGIAGVGIDLLINHWSELMDAMGLGKIKTEAEEMAELEKATSRTADQTARLNQYKKDQATIGRIMGGEPETRKTERDAVERAFTESGPDKVRGALAAQMMPEISDEQKQRIAKAWSFLPENAAAARQKVVDTVEEERNAEAWERAGKLMVEATRGGALGEAGKAGILAKIARQPGSFPKGFEDRLAGRDVEFRNAQEEEQMRADREAASKRLGKELNQQGLDAQSQHFEELRAARERVEDRLAASMKRTVGEEMMRNPKAGAAAFEGQASDLMRRAGIPEGEIAAMAKGIVRKLTLSMEEEIQGRIGTGMAPDEATARKQWLKEEREHEKADRERTYGKAEVTSLDDVIRRMTVSGLNAPDKVQNVELPKSQVGEIVKAMDGVKTAVIEKKWDGVARFAPGSARR